MVDVVFSLNIKVPNADSAPIREYNIRNNFYIMNNIPTYITTSPHTPSKPSNMTYADNNSSTPLLSAQAPLGRNNNQRPIERFLALYAGPNQLPQANGISKHRNFATMATMTCCAFTQLINSKNNYISSSFNDRLVPHHVGRLLCVAAPGVPWRPWDYGSHHG
jgi:hypothetical protein